nr:dCTP deaminase [Tepidiforma sp.]
MVLSDRTIRRELEAGNIEIDPLGADAIQPASVDLRLGHLFRVFRNSRVPFIDVKQEYPDLTELVEATAEQPFILHPGEFALAVTLERVRLPDFIVGRLEGKSSLGRLGAAGAFDGGVRGPGLERGADAGAFERGEPADRALPGDEGVADFVPAADGAGGAPVRLEGGGGASTRGRKGRRRASTT